MLGALCHQSNDFASTDPEFGFSLVPSSATGPSLAMVLSHAWVCFTARVRIHVTLISRHKVAETLNLGLNSRQGLVFTVGLEPTGDDVHLWELLEQQNECGKDQDFCFACCKLSSFSGFARNIQDGPRSGITFNGDMERHRAWLTRVLT